MNEERRLLNVFWRDSMMQEDFRIYGDVMVFDTTYKTNKYDLICAPFVGVNNTWRTSCLETHFYVAVYGVQEINGWKKSRLGNHKGNKEVSRFADLKCNDTFKETLNRCLMGCKDREEFENCWKEMIEE
ncbi:hypothetical protein ACS0TY_000652 [Phlomoides rotata]